MAVTPRAIDLIPERDETSKEMQVLALGLSRTGTLSMKRALEILGYTTYHFIEVSQRNVSNDGSHMAAWHEAQMAKIHNREPRYGPKEVKKLLRNYSAVTDTPCACFPEELIQTFPKAKVILATRDPKSWMRSMELIYYRILESREPKWLFWRCCAVLSPRLKAFQESLRMCLEQWTHGDWTNRAKLRQGFLDHADHVRSIVPKGNLLEWQVGDGWEPICKFLGKPIPDKPFPFEHKGKIAADGRAWPLGMIVMMIELKEWLRPYRGYLFAAVVAWLSCVAWVMWKVLAWWM